MFLRFFFENETFDMEMGIHIASIDIEFRIFMCESSREKKQNKTKKKKKCHKKKRVSRIGIGIEIRRNETKIEIDIPTCTVLCVMR